MAKKHHNNVSKYQKAGESSVSEHTLMHTLKTNQSSKTSLLFSTTKHTQPKLKVFVTRKKTAYFFLLTTQVPKKSQQQTITKQKQNN